MLRPVARMTLYPGRAAIMRGAHDWDAPGQFTAREGDQPPKEPPGPPRRARRSVERKGLDERFFFGVPDRFFLEKEMVQALRGSAKPSVPCGDESHGGSRK